MTTFRIKYFVERKLLFFYYCGGYLLALVCIIYRILNISAALFRVPFITQMNSKTLFLMISDLARASVWGLKVSR
jgi:hypothetical protein